MATKEYTYPYPRPMVTVDAVLLGLGEDGLDILLIRRGREPFAGRWALPGGFVEMDEPLDVAVVRELHEETGLDGISLRQLHTFGDLERDPRGRSISVAYLAVVDRRRHRPRGGDDAAEAQWVAMRDVEGLVFDHDAIVAYAIERLRVDLAHPALTRRSLCEELDEADFARLRRIVLGPSS